MKLSYNNLVIFNNYLFFANLFIMFIVLSIAKGTKYAWPLIFTQFGLCALQGVILLNMLYGWRNNDTK